MTSLVASARMYAMAPGASAAWKALFGHVSQLSGVALEVIEHAFPAPLQDLWDRPDLGCAFMCGWPYAQERQADLRPRPILAAPVPAAAWSNGEPVYRSDFIVAAQASYADLPDAFGARFAFNATGSHSGFNMPRAHLARFAGQAPLFAARVGPLVTPRRCVEAVAEGHAEITAVDSYAFDLLRLHDPDLASRVRVLASTAACPIPPLVGAMALSAEARIRLNAALLVLHLGQTGRDLMSGLDLLRFVDADPARYAAILPLELQATQAGYPNLV